MVTIENKDDNLNKIDFSIMPSLKCDLCCHFCMYNAGPENISDLDYDKTKKFLSTWDWDMINSVGFYGGEPMINLDMYQKFMDLIPNNIQKWVITNGTWSTNAFRISEVLNFIKKNELFVVVSGTDCHKIHQSRRVLKMLDNETSVFRLKGPDKLYPMGRNLLNTRLSDIDKCDGWWSTTSSKYEISVTPRWLYNVSKLSWCISFNSNI